LLAWERGEVDVLTQDWDIFYARYGEQLRVGMIHPLYVHGMKRIPEIPDAQLLTELGRTHSERAFMQIYSVGTEIGRSLAVPAGIPKERLTQLRGAFTQMLDDSAFQSAAKQIGRHLDPLDGDSLEVRIDRVLQLPSDSIAQARSFYGDLLSQVR
jgi:tripartite-type tricarboxylate transporter receptor subunit TctC